MRSQLAHTRADDGRMRRAKFVHLGRIVLMVLLVPILNSVAQPATSINPIRTIYVGSTGDGHSAEVLHQRIVDRLGKGGELKVVENPSAADVVLRGTSSIWASGTISLSPRSNSASQTIYQGYLSVELVGKDNHVLWSYLVTPSHFRTATITDDLADQVVSHLLVAIRGDMARSISSGDAVTGAHLALHAAGATLPAPLYLKWFESAGISVAYDAVGSEAGIERLAERKVDFAASDMPLTDQNTPAGLQVVQFPTVLGGVVPIYNLPPLGRTLRLTPQVLVGIYSGAIRKWNDPRIVEINRGAHLPDAEIKVIHRSDGSGTSFVWTSFLSLISSDWKTSVGAGTHVAWPTGTGATGNEGVADLTKKTPNAIGYVELIYAVQHQLNYASVRNPSGEFIKADLASIAAAGADATSRNGQDFRNPILNAPSKDAYPIATFTWILVPVRQLSPEKRSTIADLLVWALTFGQKQCASLGYGPLPREVVARQLQAVSEWKRME